MSIDASHAQRVRRLEGGRRRDGAGVRPLLRPAGPACFRGGCLTGPGHSGAELHGFLVLPGEVRRHRAAVHRVRLQGQAGPRQHPLVRSGAARSGTSSRRRAPARSTTSAAAGTSNCSMLEAIAIVERLTGRPLSWTYADTNRTGDHIWWVSDIRKFTSHYPGLEPDLHARADDRRDPRRDARARSRDPGALMPLEVRSLAEWEADGVPGLLSVVIPAHNEEGHIAATVRGLHAALAAAGITHEILVVNDNSRDRTEAVLQRAAAPRCRRCATSTTRRRTASASRCAPGSRRSRGDAVAIVMADGSDSPDDLVALLPQDAGGLRLRVRIAVRRAARSVVDYPLPKLMLNRLANFFIRMLFWMPYNDVTNAFKLYRRSVIAGVQPLLAYHFNLTVELPLKAIVRGYSLRRRARRPGSTARKASRSSRSRRWARATCSSSCTATSRSTCRARTTAIAPTSETSSCRSGHADSAR